jgi:hypothetical protein
MSGATNTNASGVPFVYLDGIDHTDQIMGDETRTGTRSHSEGAVDDNMITSSESQPLHGYAPTKVMCEESAKRRLFAMDVQTVRGAKSSSGKGTCGKRGCPSTMSYIGCESEDDRNGDNENGSDIQEVVSSKGPRKTEKCS